MKLLYILLAVMAIGINDIATVNSLKQEAQKAYDSGDYETALKKYQFLTDSMDVTSDEIMLNLAHSYYHLEDTANSRSFYQDLTESDNKKIKSVSLNQIGVLSDTPETEKVALNYFKEALKADPTNKEARYNYEVLKKRLKEKEEQQKQDQENKDQQNKDQEDQKKEEEKDKEEKQDSKEEKEEDKKEEKKDGEKSEEEKEGEKEENQDKEGEEKKDGKEQEKKEGEEKDKEGEKKEEEQFSGQPFGIFLSRKYLVSTALKTLEIDMR